MKVKDLSFIAIYAALSLVFEVMSKMIPIFQMPQGGSVNLGVVVVLVASFHLSWKKGMLVGVLWWLLGFLLGMNAWYLNPMQYALDYLIPVMVCGAAAFFPKVGKDNILIGVGCAMVLRFISFLLSGVYYWPPEAEVAGSMAAWVYSWSYNIGYNLVTLIVAFVLVPLCIKRLQKQRVEFKGIKS